MTTHRSRRDFVKSAAILGAAAVAAPSAAAASPSPLPGMPRHDAPLTPHPGGLYDVARDEAYWTQVAAKYRITPRTTNLEAGYFGMMALPVLEAYHRNIDRANSESSYFARREFPGMMRNARERVAAFVGAKPTELAFSRGATEALQALIGQYNRVQPGDTVMYADLDYNAMQWAMNALAARCQAKVVTLDIPEPASHDNILAAYTTALDANPRTKLLLLTHCNNKTGLLLPVGDIAKLAKARGVDVVVDAAHSFGQVPLTMADMGADFVGLNLHKWIGAPVGAGALYIREGRLDAIDRAHADESAPLDRIESRIHTGTTNFATVMTIPDAIDFQLSIGYLARVARIDAEHERLVGQATKLAGAEYAHSAVLVEAFESARAAVAIAVPE